MYTACSDGSQQKTSATLNWTLHGDEGNHILSITPPQLLPFLPPSTLVLFVLYFRFRQLTQVTSQSKLLHNCTDQNPCRHRGGSDPAVETRPSRGPNDMNSSSKFPVPGIYQELPKWKCSYEVLASSHAQGDVNVLSSVMLVRLNWLFSIVGKTLKGGLGSIWKMESVFYFLFYVIAADVNYSTLKLKPV